MRLLDEPYNRDDLLRHMREDHGHLFRLRPRRTRFFEDDDTDVLHRAHREDHGGEDEEPDHAHA